MAELSTYLKVYGLFFLATFPLWLILLDGSCKLYRLIRYGEED